MNLGFDKSNLLYMPMTGEMWSKQQAFKARVKTKPAYSKLFNYQ